MARPRFSLGDAQRLERAIVELNRQPVTSGFDDLGPAMERSAYFILGKLHRSGAMSIGQLAEAFGLDQSTINRQTKALMVSGLIERIADPEGGIARKFVLTDEGLRRFTAHRDWRLDGLVRVLDRWSSAEVNAFSELLERFTGDVDAYRLAGRREPEAPSGRSAGPCAASSGERPPEPNAEPNPEPGVAG